MFESKPLPSQDQSVGTLRSYSKCARLAATPGSSRCCTVDAGDSGSAGAGGPEQAAKKTKRKKTTAVAQPRAGLWLSVLIIGHASCQLARLQSLNRSAQPTVNDWRLTLVCH